MDDFLKVTMNEYLPLRDVVFNTLRQAILKGELKPGERLMEIQLADRLGVSRTPVREAIRKLELEGLVVMIPRKGAEVASITESDLQDVLEVRRALEELAGSKACERITKEELVKLKEASAEFEKIIDSGDLTMIADADMHFHDIIYQATGNARLNQILNNMTEQMYRYRMEYLKDYKRHAKLVKEHEKIISALKAGNQEKVRDAIIVHIDNQKKAIEKSLKG